MTVWWLSPGDPDQRTGGYLYNARMVAELRAIGHGVEVLALDGRWPLPGIDDVSPLARIPDGASVVADGLLWPGLGPAGPALASRCRVSVLVHSLLARETGLPSDVASILDSIERRALDLPSALVATSDLTRDELGRPAAVVLPGTDRAARSPGGHGTQLLTVGTLTRRKQHDRLFEALEGLAAPWRLTCAGGARDPEWAASLARIVTERGLSDRVSFAGDLDAAALDTLYARADIVVQVAAYEAFGMAIAEAVARGLPVITTPAGVNRHLPKGAVREVDDDTLVDTLSDLLLDSRARRAQADRAWAAADRLPTWTTQAERLAAVILGESP